MDNEKKDLSQIISIVYLTPENAKFERKNDFLALTATLPKEDGTSEEKTFERIFLHRAFPFDYPDSYISVLDGEQKEIGLISKVDVFGKETADLLEAELKRKYYSPVVLKINTIKERYGYSYWSVDTDEGELSFSLRDTYRSMIKVDGHRIIINDIDGNRYEIPDIETLDHKSFKKIELYL